jgi:hypothetical protein
MKLFMKALAIVLFAALGNAYGQAPVVPTLPQNTVSLVLPTQGTSSCPTLTTGSNCIRNVGNSGNSTTNATDFQNAINAATCGDTIQLVAGTTYSGNFTIPATSCSGWIEIQSNMLDSLPLPGNRVGPSNAANMAKVSTPNTSPALLFLPGSNHWRLMGLEITNSSTSTATTVFNLVLSGYRADASTPNASQAVNPASIIFDRNYIHGFSGANVTRGIGMDGVSMAVVDSYCDEIHNNGSDAQCFYAFQGAGPYLIQNNFIQAAGENVMFGGTDPVITGAVPSDITITGNLFQKNIAWRGQAAPLNWVVKNLFELKNAQRVLLEGNVIQTTWAAGQDEAIILRSINQSGACTWCVVQDVTVTHNIIRHAPMGIVIGGPEGGPALSTSRILVQNNVLDDISLANWGSRGWAFHLNVGNIGPRDIIIDHNTAFADQALGFLGDTGTMTNVEVTNDLSNYGVSGITGNGTGSGMMALSTFAPGYIYNDNAFITATGASIGTYPTGTLWNTLAGLKLVNFTGSNYQLTSTSPYLGAGTDGKDIGVWDWSCLNNDSTAALAGKFVPSLGGCAAASGNLVAPPTNLKAVAQ